MPFNQGYVCKKQSPLQWEQRRQHDNPVVFRPQQHAIKQQQQQQQQQQNKDKSKKMSAHPIQGKRKSSCFS